MCVVCESENPPFPQVVEKLVRAQVTTALEGHAKLWDGHGKPGPRQPSHSLVRSLAKQVGEVDVELTAKKPKKVVEKKPVARKPKKAATPKPSASVARRAPRRVKAPRLRSGVIA